MSYLGFRKAFDTVPHQRLLNKVEAYGIKGMLLMWLKDFLVGRKQRVVLNGKKSEWTDVKSGIPQGSVLGPILFELYINDMPDVVDSDIRMFADDMKIYRRSDSNEDREKLQDDLRSLERWSEKWQLGFNTSKCKTMHLGYRNNRQEYSMGGNVLSQTREEKDLGVIVDDGLLFRPHITAAANKANQMMGVALHTFEDHSANTIVPIYLAHVRPHLEYGNLLWHPRYKKDSITVENVQRRATKRIPELKDLSYGERLAKLDLPSLQYRRDRGDMIQVYKIFTGRDRLNPDDFFEMSRSQGTRGHLMKVQKHHSSTLLKRNVFSRRVVDLWNSLPDDVVKAETMNQFKNRIDKTWRGDRFKYVEYGMDHVA